jgi:hypothetical protein
MLKHFLQYHNVGEMERDCIDVEGYGIVTSKNWPKIINQRMWLVRGAGTPRQYHLVETFLVQRFCATIEDGRFRYYAESDADRTGQKQFGLEIEIGKLSWFPALFKTSGHFGLGLIAITNPKIIAGLQEASGIKD